MNKLNKHRATWTAAAVLVLSLLVLKAHFNFVQQHTDVQAPPTVQYGGVDARQ